MKTLREWSDKMWSTSEGGRVEFAFMEDIACAIRAEEGGKG